ncbi:hypothetical protein QE152_g5374 [Popillia japonica]|uniref:Uncharacterized protein n=1 Tax=Popillia japonica TaxID=7064 RepID=A0AAW1MMA9_POPJA
MKSLSSTVHRKERTVSGSWKVRRAVVLRAMKKWRRTERELFVDAESTSLPAAHESSVDGRDNATNQHW